MFWKEDSGRQPQLITPENEGEDETSSPSPPYFTFFDDPDVPFDSKPRGPSPEPPDQPDPQDHPGFPPGLPPAPPPAGGERTRTLDTPRERSRPRSPLPEPQLSPIPVSDGDDDQPPQNWRQRQQSRSRDPVYPHAQMPQVPQVQPMVIQESVTDPDEAPTVENPSSSTGPSQPAEQRGRSRRQQRSRSRERTPQRTPSHSGQQPQPVAPPPGEHQIQPMASQDMYDDMDEDSATVEPQVRMNNRSTLQKRKKSQEAVRHKFVDSDEDNGEPVNEPGTSSTLQPFVPVLPLHPGPTASSQGPAASAIPDNDDSDYSDEYSAQSQDSRRTLIYPALYVLTNDEHWTATSETAKYAASAGPF